MMLWGMRSQHGVVIWWLWPIQPQSPKQLHHWHTIWISLQAGMLTTWLGQTMMLWGMGSQHDIAVWQWPIQPQFPKQLHHQITHWIFTGGDVDHMAWADNDAMGNGDTREEDGWVQSGSANKLGHIGGFFSSFVMWLLQCSTTFSQCCRTCNFGIAECVLCYPQVDLVAVCQRCNSNPCA